MSTPSSARNLFPPLDNPELTIQRRSRADPTLLNDFEMAAKGNGDPQFSTSGLWRNHNSCQFHGLPCDDANKHLDKFLHVTKSIKGNGLTNDAIRLQNVSWRIFSTFHGNEARNKITNFCQRPDESLFEAWERYKLSIDRCPNHNMLPVTQIDTFHNGLTLRHRDTINAAAGGTFMKRRPEDCYDLIENMTAHHNDWDTSAQRSELSSSITTSSDLEILARKAELSEINKNLIRVLQVNQQVKAVTPNCKTCGGLHSYNDCPATVGQTQNIYVMGAYQGGNTITNPKEDLKGITTRSGTAYQGPTTPTTSSSLPKVVECETEVTKDMMPPTNNGSTKDVRPPVVYIETPIPNSEPVVAPVNALILMPKFGPTIKTLLTDKDKLYELAINPLNEHCLTVLLKKLPKTLRDPGNHFPQVRKELKICEAKNDKCSIDEPSEVELKDLPPHLEYVFLEDHNKLPVIISKDLSDEEKTALIKVLKSHKLTIAWKLSDIKDSPWVSPIHCVPKKGGFNVVENEENELIPTRLVTGWRVCIDYRKLIEATRKDHFPLPFMDQMLKRLAGNEYYCFIDGFSVYFQIPIDLKDQEKTTFTSPYETFAYRRMPFGLCNAPGTFQRCMMAIFHDMIKKRWKSSWTTSRFLGILLKLVPPIWKRSLNGVKTKIFV
uniref:Reverse transcriptase domain-containing protein n=1 Tax=Tanacetum cinerariifolium TaxID=118510 RepID=A0A699GR48_TANCI|nr:reverse transcriptase domain-containing protein [Tanacetum cinerariifolium]